MDTVYRSTHPDIIALVESWPQLYSEWDERCKAALTKWGFEGHNTWTTQSGFSGVRMAGIDPGNMKRAPIGWHKEPRQDYYVPSSKPNTKAQHALREEFRELQNMPDVRKLFADSMPVFLFAGLGVVRYASTYRDGVVWIRWPDCDPERTAASEEGCRGMDGTVNRDLWERVPLSEFYAMVEAGNDPFAPLPEDNADATD